MVAEPEGEKISAALLQKALMSHGIDCVPRCERDTRRDHDGASLDMMNVANNPVQGQQHAVELREIDAAKSALSLDPNVPMSEPKVHALARRQLGRSANRVKCFH
jgi:hypothetical protein